MGRTVLLILPVVAVFVLAVYYMVHSWNALADVQMGTNGYIAMGLGVLVTLCLAGVLITLLLRRDRDEE